MASQTTNAGGHLQLEYVTSLIAAEYSYIAQTAFQANEDRAKASQFFLVTFGTIIAAVFSSEANLSRPASIEIKCVFIILFGLLVLYGTLTLLQLAKLRIAWIHSVEAMNTMKHYAAVDCPSLKRLFVWNSGNTPAPFTLWSVGFLHAFFVAVLSGVSTGAVVAFMTSSQTSVTVNWLMVLTTTVIAAAIALLICYVVPLKMIRIEASRPDRSVIPSGPVHPTCPQGTSPSDLGVSVHTEDAEDTESTQESVQGEADRRDPMAR